ncbi:hypothetical protein SCLCIDRAFT_1220464, partial [Scleroderma citrinum Foug A]
MPYFRTRLNGVPQGSDTSSPLCSVPTRSDDRSHHAQPLDELIESLVMIWWLEAFVDSDVLTQFQDESRTLQVL